MGEHKPPTVRVEYDTCDKCVKQPSIEGESITTAMVSQAEVWQEDKKFTVSIVIFSIYDYYYCRQSKSCVT